MTAKKTASKAVAVRKGSTAIATVDAQLASEVANIMERVNQPSGNRIKFEPSGNIVLPDGMNLGTHAEFVVVDFISANRYYADAYDPNNLAPPDCFAMGTNLSTMAPDDLSPQKESDNCARCPYNQFGSANGGRGAGKACKNSRELAVLLIDPETEQAGTTLYTISLPPTAIKSFDGMVSYVARSLNGPMIKAVVTISGKAQGTYALISFSEPRANPDYAQHMAFREDAQPVLWRKPDYAAVEKPVKKAGAKRAPARR